MLPALKEAGHSSRTRTLPGPVGTADSRTHLPQHEDFWEKPEPTWPGPQADLAPQHLLSSVGGQDWGPVAEAGVPPGWLPGLSCSLLSSQQGLAATTPGCRPLSCQLPPGEGGKEEIISTVNEAREVLD